MKNCPPHHIVTYSIQKVYGLHVTRCDEADELFCLFHKEFISVLDRINAYCLYLS